MQTLNFPKQISTDKCFQLLYNKRVVRYKKGNYVVKEVTKKMSR